MDILRGKQVATIAHFFWAKPRDILGSEYGFGQDPKFPKVNIPNMDRTHTHTYIYIYVYYINGIKNIQYLYS